MKTYAIHFKQTDRRKIELLINFVKSLDFVDSVEEASIPYSILDAEIQQPASTTNENSFLSVKQIRQRYPNEWVLVAEAQFTEGKLSGGKVVLHDPDKRSMALRSKDLIRAYERVTHFYTGDMSSMAKIGVIRKAL